MWVLHESVSVRGVGKSIENRTLVISNEIYLNSVENCLVK